MALAVTWPRPAEGSELAGHSDVVSPYHEQLAQLALRPCLVYGFLFRSESW